MISAASRHQRRDDGEGSSIRVHDDYETRVQDGDREIDGNEIIALESTIYEGSLSFPHSSVTTRWY